MAEYRARDMSPEKQFMAVLQDFWAGCRRFLDPSFDYEIVRHLFLRCQWKQQLTISKKTCLPCFCKEGTWVIFVLPVNRSFFLSTSSHAPG